MQYSAVALISVSALPSSGPVGRSFHSDQLTTDAYLRQISQVSLSLGEIGDERNQAVNLEAVGIAGVGQKLFGLLRVIFGNREFDAIGVYGRRPVA